MECKLAGALEKIFSAKGPLYPAPPLSILRGETASFQAAILARDDLRVTASCPGFSLRVREVLEMPVRMPSFPDREDENYLSTAPGLFPDLLRDLPGGILRARGRWKAVWIDADPEADCPAGKHEILVTFESPSGEKETAVQTVTLVDAALPPQTLLHTEWFHADCLADYYGVEPLGEEHWRILENFLRAAARMGINMILTPVLTPPLDTAVGGERTTVQLVKIRRDEGVFPSGSIILRSLISTRNGAPSTRRRSWPRRTANTGGSSAGRRTRWAAPTPDSYGSSCPPCGRS